MAEAEFNFEGKLLIIQFNSDEKMEDIIKKFVTKVDKKREDLIFMYGGEIIKRNLTFNEIANESDKARNKISILVSNILNNDISIINQNESFQKSLYVICPECKETIRFLIKNYKITLYDCKNNHKINDIPINDFDKTQNVDESKIKCEKCNNANKKTAYNNIFYICLTCNKNLCPLCQSCHDKTHNIINYNDKYFMCLLHNELYNSYCNDCKKDICLMCEMAHSGHKIVSYGLIMPDINKIKNETNNFLNKIEEFKNEIKKIINKLNDLNESIENYLDIYKDIINSYEMKKRNYSVLQNINDIINNNNDFIQDINKIINEKNINDKFNEMIILYNKLNPKNIEQLTEKVIKKEEKNENENKIEIKKDEKDVVNNIDNQNLNEIKKDIENKNIENNNKLISLEKKEESNNDSDTYILKKIKSVKYGLKTDKLYTLKDGRIIVITEQKEGFVFNLDKNTNFKLNLNDILDVIQMDDDLVVVQTKKDINVIEIKENNIEIIQSINVNSCQKCNLITKWQNKTILIMDDKFNLISFFYENKKLKKKSKKMIVSKIKLKEIEDIFPINSIEIVIEYYEEGGFFSSGGRYICFYDLEKNKKKGKIENYSFSISKKALINSKYFAHVQIKHFEIINLYDYSYNTFQVEDVYENILLNRILSIFALNEEFFIVGQVFWINIYKIQKSGKIYLSNRIKLNFNKIAKYLNNKIVVNEENNEEEFLSIYNLKLD